MTNLPESKSKGVSVIGALAGMLITFVAGIFVGLHPAWIPIKGAGGPDASETQKLPPSIMSTPDHPGPQTQPATSP